MRVNVYAEEMTDLIEIVEKETGGGKFTGLRLYLQLPVTTTALFQDQEAAAAGTLTVKEELVQTRGPFMHSPNDDDSSAVTFWGKKDLRRVLYLMLNKLDEHYRDSSHQITNMWESQAQAWSSVFEKLYHYNPTFMSRPYTGEKCAVKEIERLQESDRMLNEVFNDLGTVKNKLKETEDLLRIADNNFNEALIAKHALTTELARLRQIDTDDLTGIGEGS